MSGIGHRGHIVIYTAVFVLPTTPRKITGFDNDDTNRIHLFNDGILTIIILVIQKYGTMSIA